MRWVKKNPDRGQRQDQCIYLQKTFQSRNVRPLCKQYFGRIQVTKRKIYKKKIRTQPSVHLRMPPWKTSLFSAATVAVFLRQNTRRFTSNGSAPFASESFFPTSRSPKILVVRANRCYEPRTCGPGAFWGASRFPAV